MADFFVYQPIDMLNEADLGWLTRTSTDISQFDKKGYQTQTNYLVNGGVVVNTYFSPKGDTPSMYMKSKEYKGRYKIENSKIRYQDWIKIYGGDQYYSDLSKISYSQQDRTGNTIPDVEVEIFAKILEGSDNITGSGGGDYLYSFRGDDLVNPSGGDDYVNGGSGVDTVEYSGNRDSYTLNRSTDNSGIQYVIDYRPKEDRFTGEYTPNTVYLATPDRAFKVSGPDGNDTLVDVEKLKFKDGTYNIATGAFTEEDNSSSSGKRKGGKSKKNKRRKGKKTRK